MRQIEQLGQVLAQLLTRLLNIKRVPSGGLNLEEIKNIYSDELDLTLDLIMETPGDGIIELLKSRVKFMDQHLEKMAEIITETAELYESAEEKETARDLREKCIIIYEHLQDTSGIYSLDRIMKISQLKELL